MGYSTDFYGRFEIDKKLDKETHALLTGLATTRRMARKLDPKYGVEGEFYVESISNFGQDREANIVDYNRPPKTQPSLWLQWIPTTDGKFIEWDGGEKFYSYVEWLEYIIEKVLKPRGYTLDGIVEWQGEESRDMGVIVVSKNKIKLKRAHITLK